jgi:hypothetical protein
MPLLPDPMRLPLINETAATRPVESRSTLPSMAHSYQIPPA